MPSHVAQASLLTYDERGAEAHETTLVREAAVAIRVNGVLVARTQCMPDGLAELAVGFLVTAGVVCDRTELRQVAVDVDSLAVEVTAELPPGRLARLGERQGERAPFGRGVRVPGGIAPPAAQVNGGQARSCTEECPPAPSGTLAASRLTMEAARIMELGHQFDTRPGLYQQTQCVHSAALSDGDRYLHFAEDLGRHSAVDKVVGQAFCAGACFSDLVLLCSGRFALDMVGKVACVGIPLVISPAAATHEAAQMAERCQIALCGRVRRGSMTVYSAPWRVR
ncbi:MAG: formate dehydrogenase accessory sulfurtransferase FdhD [Thermoanaerobaculaceae bacterium]